MATKRETWQSDPDPDPEVTEPETKTEPAGDLPTRAEAAAADLAAEPGADPTVYGPDPDGQWRPS